MKILLTLLSVMILATPVSSCSKNNGNSAVDGWEDMFDKDDDDGNGEVEETHFKMRGLVLGWSEVCNPEKIDYIKIASENGINTFSIYNAPRPSETWDKFTAKCKAAGIDLEFEEHMMSFLLPRDYFNTHPEYFRMDANGNRVKDANGCPSSEGALAIVHENAIRIGRNYKPTNNKYYFWLDDGGDICHCPKCKHLNAAEQALIFENEVISALKEINPDACLAHLCYDNTLDAPKQVKPHEDIFLEFAPFYRNWSEPLTNKAAKGRTGLTHQDYMRALSENLKVFPKETAQVLEYWMDESLFCGWDPNNLVKLPWNKNVFLSDINTYASYGIKNITCYAAYIGPDYVDKFGDVSFLSEYGQGLLNYGKE